MPQHSDGLTLAELAQIGEEAGISVDAIRRASASLDVSAPDSGSVGASIGIPLSVARTANLDSAFSDGDWDRLVADLEQTFRVTGRTRRYGAVREWKGDEVTVIVEPSQSGHRLNIRAVDHAGKVGLIGGAIFLAMGLFFTLLVVAKAGSPDLAKILFTSMFSVVGLGGMGYSAYRGRSWNARINRDIEAIAVRAVEKSGAQQDGAGSPSVTPGKIDPELLSDQKDGGGDDRQPGNSRRSRT